jgi:hypothetical protein
MKCFPDLALNREIHQPHTTCTKKQGTEVSPVRKIAPNCNPHSVPPPLYHSQPREPLYLRACLAPLLLP